MDKINFKNSRGEKISGICSCPGSDSVVIICHGLGTSKNSSPYPVLEHKINKLGMATFRFDLYGHGDSSGNYEDLTLTEAIDDIVKAKEEMLKKGYTHVGFIGSSFGAVGGIMAASQTDFDFLVLISPPTYYDISEMFKSSIHVLRELWRFRNKKKDDKKAGITLKFFRDYGSHDSYDAAKKIKAPVLVIQGSDDKIVPPEKTRLLHKKIKNSRLKIFKGADHHYTHPLAQIRLVNEIMKFVEENKA
jgi:uncharacterized protein